MRMSYNGLLSQPSKLMTRVRLPSSALKKLIDKMSFFLFKSSFYKDLDKKMQAFSGTKALICSTPNREACNNRVISKPMVKTMVKSMVKNQSEIKLLKLINTQFWKFL